MSSNSILALPAPAVQIRSLDAQAIGFELSFRVRDFNTAATAKHEVYDLIYRHTRAAGLSLAQPKEASAVAAAAAPQAPAAAPSRTTTLRMLDAVPLFASLTEEEKEALASTMTRRTYRRDDIVVEQGAKLNSLMVIRSGVVVVSRRDHDHDVELSRLAPGDYFGEGGVFTGAAEKGKVRALTAVVIYEVSQAGLAQLMHERPGIADEISVTLCRRAHLGPAPVDETADDMRSVPRLVARIRHLFEVPHA
jgi:hypothetical protein